MESPIEIEVHETVEDCKEFQKRNNFFIEMPLILILILILSSIGEKFNILDIFKGDKKTLVFFLIAMIAIIIVGTIGFYRMLIKSFKEDLVKRPEKHNYIIRFYTNYLETTKGEIQKIEYGKTKFKRGKNHYFIRYRDPSGIQVCLIKKEVCTPEAINCLENLLKK